MTASLSPLKASTTYLEEDFAARLLKDVQALSTAQQHRSDSLETHIAAAQTETLQKLQHVHSELESGQASLLSRLVTPLTELQASVQRLGQNFADAKDVTEKELRARCQALEEEQKDMLARLRYKEDELSAFKSATDDKVERLRTIIDEVAFPSLQNPEEEC